MKIVVNRCYGGFGLSPQATELYAEKCGFKVFGYQKDYSDESFGKYIRFKVGDEPWCIHWLKEDLGVNPTSDMLNNDVEWFHDWDIPRDDKNLIEVVEALGEKASGPYAELVIIDIPDDVDWEIDEYDGYETIHEKHRSW